MRAKPFDHRWRELRTTFLPARPPPMTAADVKRLRAQPRASQAVFAHWLNVSPKLVQAWEGGRRVLVGAALRLLRLVEKHPELLLGWPPRPRRQPNT